MGYTLRADVGRSARTSEAIVDKLGYVLANPVAAGLVRYARDWPGAKSHPEDLGGATMRAPRPRVYLNVANERWPTVAALELTLPLGVDADDAGAWRNAVKAAVAEHEVRGRAEVARQGWKFLGAERAESVSPYDRATSFEPLRGRNPTFAVGGVPGVHVAAVAALRAFRSAYSAAVERWRAGVRDVVFPAGTWWMVRWHAAVVAT
jgi:putative transposase